MTYGASSPQQVESTFDVAFTPACDLSSQSNDEGTGKAEGSQDLVDGLVGLVESERRTRKPNVVVLPKRTRQRKTQLALAVSVSILIAWHGVSFGVPLVKSYFEARPPAAAARQEAQAMLTELIEDIEMFRQNYNEPPESLVEIGVPSRGKWTYALLGKKDYTLRGSLYGQGVAFDSTARSLPDEAATQHRLYAD